MSSLPAAWLLGCAADATLEPRQRESLEVSDAGDAGRRSPFAEAGLALRDAGAFIDFDAGYDAGVLGKRVFVTSGLYAGDLRTRGSGSDGLDGADRICQSLADGAALEGTFRAFVSTANYHAIERLDDVGPWVLVDGTLVFPTRAALVSGIPSNPLDRDETGRQVTAPALPDGGMNPILWVWTGTRAGGARDPSARCSDWMTSSRHFRGVMGRVGARTTEWTEATRSGCGDMARLYCFEQ